MSSADQPGVPFLFSSMLVSPATFCLEAYISTHFYEQKLEEGMERRSYNNDYNGYHLFRDYYASDSVLIVFTSIASFNLCKNPMRKTLFDWLYR